MKRKTKYKSAPLNIVVTIICLAVFFASLWLFFNDLTSSSSRADKKAVATVTFKYKIAQRKFDDRVVWERLQQNAPLYNGDTIRTADLAQATIHLDGGINIELSENTMVQIIVTKDGKISLAIDGGQVNVDTTNSTSDVQIDMGNGIVVSVEKGSKLSAKLDETNLNAGIKLTAGNATVKTGENDKEPAQITAGESVKVNENGAITKTPVTVTSLSGMQRILVFENDNVPPTVPIEWALSGNTENNRTDTPKRIVVETSNKKDFSEIKTSYTVEDVSKVEIPADDGALYWRVYLEGDEENSAEGKILFESVSNVVPTSPLEDSVYNYYDEKPDVVLSWAGNDYTSKYKIEVSKNPNMIPVETVREVTDANFVLPEVEEGTYYWRIVPYYEVNEIGWYGGTEPQTFIVSKQDEPLPPSLSFPLDEKKYTYTSNTFDADFSWKGDNTTSNYVLEVSKDEDFSNIVYSQVTDSKSVHVPLSVYDFSDGEYFWRVKQIAQTSDGEEKEIFSDTRKFEVAEYVAEPNKLLHPEDLYSVEAESLKSVNFTWKISPESAKRYASESTIIQFSSTEDFSDLVFEKEVSGSSIKNVNLEEGTYFWRVRKGRSRTEPRTIKVVGKLKSPKITAPRENDKLILDANQQLVIRWEKIPEVDFYRLKILDADTNRTLKEINNLASESAFFPTEVLSKNNRRFKIQVQAYVAESNLSSARKSEISELIFAARLSTNVRLVSPENQARINGLDALKDGVTLKWAKDGESFTNIKLNVWKVETGEKRNLVQSYTNPRETINLPRMTEGTYQWTVTADAKDGFSGSAKETREFVVLPIQKLEAPVLVTPERNFKMDGNYFRRNRTINFSWKNVRGATDYTFVLYQKLPNGSLNKLYSSEHQKGTQVRIRDLSIFDLGEFQWEVEAYNRSKDGFVYQDGKIASQKFTIDFSRAKKLEMIDPGEMFGD